MTPNKAWVAEAVVIEVVAEAAVAVVVQAPDLVAAMAVTVTRAAATKDQAAHQNLLISGASLPWQILNKVFYQKVFFHIMLSTGRVVLLLYLALSLVLYIVSTSPSTTK